MICAGLYKSLKSNSFSAGADGLFIFDITTSLKINHKNFYDIPLEIINQYTKERVQNRNAKKEEKGGAQFKNLIVKELAIQDDNSLILIGEAYYKKHYENDGNPYTAYHNDDMLITKIAPDGQLSWMKKIPKRQYSVTSHSSCGFQYIELKNKHYIVLVDNPKNMTLELDKRPAVYIDGKPGVLIAYGIDDATGEVSKTSILDFKDVKGIKIRRFFINGLAQSSPNELIFETYKGKKEDVMIKIKVE